MNHERVTTTLRLIQKLYRPILDASHEYVIPAAIAQVGAGWRAYQAAKKKSPHVNVNKTWGYTITHEQPLRFAMSAVRDLDLQVDIYCNVQWADAQLPISQDIKVRIWSHHHETIYDPSRDAEQVLKRLTDPTRPSKGRVVSRFHFDHVSDSQRTILECSPEYHLQFGGKPEDYEICWHPKKINVPRLPFQPMELFLTCQVVAASFFPEQYLEIAEKREWREEVILYQRLMLKDYYKRCLKLIEDGESLLDGLQGR